MARGSEIGEHLRKWANTHNWICWQIRSPTTRGVPDKLFVSPTGLVVFVEIKGAGDRLHGLQEYWLKRLLDNCAEVYVCHNAQVGIAHLEELEKCHNRGSQSSFS